MHIGSLNELVRNWRLARKHRFWLDPYLPQHVRVEVAEQLSTVLWRPMLILALLAQIVLLMAGGLNEPTRFIPGCVWLTALVAARVLANRNTLAGFGVAISGLVLATTFAVLAHSVHAPAYWLNVLALAVIVPLYGARAGFWLTAWCAMTGAAWFLLNRIGWTTGIVRPPSLLAYLFLVGCLGVGVALMSIPTRLFAAALHSSEQRRLEAEQARLAMQYAERAFRAIFEQKGTLTALVEPDGTLLRLNPTGERLLGIGPNAPRVGSLLDLPWTGENAVSSLKHALQRAVDGTERLEIELERPTCRLHLQLAIAPVKDLDGRLQTLVVEGLDCTRLIEAERELAHARRLEALGQLAGGVAHDFNNMLLAIQGAVESLRSQQQSSIEHLDAVEIIDQATHRASELTHKLLAFGRRDRFDTQIINLELLISDATQLFRRTLGASVRLALDFGTQGTSIVCDAAAIEHALLNLVVNARDAMPRGGVIRLSTRLLTVDQAWCKTQTFSATPGTLVELSVEDDGVGMTEDVRARAFEPFFTTKAVGMGTGLGLAAVHGTMLAHGGGVTVESVLGRGSRFRLCFPLAPASAETRVHRSGIGTSLRLSGRILVVDDEPLVLRVAKRYLNAVGVEAVLVSDGVSALSALNTGQTFDCILTDFVMPNMSGTTLIERIREEFPDLPIVIMSGFPARMDEHAEGVLANCPWLRKPFGRGDLVKVLEPILGKAFTAWTRVQG